jgi:UDP-glucose:glycoprotein glucosyltransferase
MRLIAFLLLLCCNSIWAGQVNVELRSEWLDTDLWAEMSELVAEHGATEASFWHYIENLGGKKDDDVSRHAANYLDSRYGSFLVEWALQFRHYSPSVAAHSAAALALVDDAQKCRQNFAFLWPCNTLVYDYNELSADVLDKCHSSGGDVAQLDGFGAAEHRRMNVDDADVVVVLYARFDSTFAAFYDKVVGLLSDGQLAFDTDLWVRHACSSASDGQTVALRGYGVELALKNMEYRAMDEQGNVDVDADVDDEWQVVGGIDFERLAQRHGGDEAAALRIVQAEMLSGGASADEVLDMFESLRPWEVSELGMQSMQWVLATGDRNATTLRRLVDVSQNFPLLAPSLSRAPVNERTAARVDMLRRAGVSQGSEMLLLNGRSLPASTIDPFELLDAIAYEARFMRSLRALPDIDDDAAAAIPYLPTRAAADRQASDGGDALRYDVRCEHAIYLNDVETNVMYARMSPHLEAMHSGWPGNFRPLRRNIVTVTIFFDVFDVRSQHALHAIAQMMRQGAPLRFALVFVGDAQDGAQDDAQDGESGALMQQHMMQLLSSIQDEYGAMRALFTLLELFGDGDIGSADGRRAWIESLGDATSGAAERQARALQESRAFAASMNLHGTQVFVNGQRIELAAGDSLMQAIAERVFGTEYPALDARFEELLELDADGKLRGDGVLQWLLSADNVVKRHSDVVFGDVHFESITDYAPIADSLRYVVQRNRDAAADDEDEVKLLTYWLAADFNGRDALALAYESVSHMSRRMHARLVRTAFVHVGAQRSPLYDAIQCALALPPSSRAKLFVVAALRKFAKGLQDGDAPAATIESLWQKHLSAHALDCDQVSDNVASLFASDSTTLLVNGRRIDVSSTTTAMRRRDFNLLDRVEMIERVRRLTTPSFFDALALPARRKSDIAMYVVATLALDKHERAYVPVELTPAWQSSSSSSSSSLIDIVAVLDPLGAVAQRVAPLLATLVELERDDVAHVRLYLNPSDELHDLPIKRFYRYVVGDDAAARFDGMPEQRIMTMQMSTPDAWLVESRAAHDSGTLRAHDMDNIHLIDASPTRSVSARYALTHLLVHGSCTDRRAQHPPQGLQLRLDRRRQSTHDAIVDADGRVDARADRSDDDTIVMQNFGYYQLKASPGLWHVRMADGTASELYSFDDGADVRQVLVRSFAGASPTLHVARRPGTEHRHLIGERDEREEEEEEEHSFWPSMFGGGDSLSTSNESASQTINVFSLASGHLYERFIKIMMLSVLEHTESPVKFWLLENYASPSFKESLASLARRFNFDYEFVTYRWPSWLHAQTEKQRVIWGYKILFLDVLFPLDVDRIIFVDADQIVRADLAELMRIDLHGAPYGYTPMCSSRTEMDGFRFWNQGFWKTHLAGKPYHISALYVVDLRTFRRIAAGDRLRATYAALAPDPNSLANLDQDLPNYMQHQLPIFSLPQHWLWCETWCDDASKRDAKTIDLCNNPLTKTPKLDNAIRIVPEWLDYDEQIE